MGHLRPKARNRLMAPVFLPSRLVHLLPKGTPWVFVHMSVQRLGEPRIAGKQAVLWGGVWVSFESGAGQRGGALREGWDSLRPPGAGSCLAALRPFLSGLMILRCRPRDGARCWGYGCPHHAPCVLRLQGRGPVSCGRQHGSSTCRTPDIVPVYFSLHLCQCSSSVPRCSPHPSPPKLPITSNSPS